MKFLNLRKYIFANIIAIWFYYFLYFNYGFIQRSIINKLYVYSDFTIIWAFIIYMHILILGLIIFLFILEILFKKLIIKKKFPNLKLNIHINVPKFIIIIYNALFSIGLILSIILFFIAAIFYVYRVYYIN